MYRMRRKNIMNDIKWEVVAEVNGGVQAEIMRGLLEAQKIPVFLSQEGAGRAMGMDIGELGSVQVLVPSDKAALASEIIQEYFSGKYENTEIDSTQNIEDDDVPWDEQDQGYS